MLVSDFEKTEHFKLMLLVGEYYQSMEAKFIANGSDFVCTSKDIRLDPVMWFKLLVFYFGYKTQSIDGEENRIAFLAQARSNTVQLVESLYEMIDEVKTCKKYDFSGVINKIDALIHMGKTELEARLLTSQLVTNDNTKETNIANKKLLRLTTVFSAAALIVSVWGMKYTILGYNREVNKDAKEEQTKQMSSQIQAERSINVRLKEENEALKHWKDSVTSSSKRP